VSRYVDIDLHRRRSVVVILESRWHQGVVDTDREFADEPGGSGWGSRR
jgi:hypothetical protein